MEGDSTILRRKSHQNPAPTIDNVGPRVFHSFLSFCFTRENITGDPFFPPLTVSNQLWLNSPILPLFPYQTEEIRGTT